MEISNLITHVEVLIFASEKPLTSIEITELINNAFGFMDDKISQEQIDATIEAVIEKYNADFYPFEVRESGGGWQFLTKRSYHQTVAQLNGDKFLKRLSSAAMESLAIIAYKQPITKGEIEAIRGVNSDYSVQKLLEKELIVIHGRNEKLPGRPLLYTTSKGFMDYFGINSAEELPKISEVLAEQLVEPTIIKHSDAELDELYKQDLLKQKQVADSVDATFTQDNELPEEIAIQDEALQENDTPNVQIVEEETAADDNNGTQQD
jgi:segregation and condensation protein B